LTEKMSTMGSLREVDEFIIHPNVLRRLQVGQAVWKFKDTDPEVISLGMFCEDYKGIEFEKIQHKQGEGLNLREKRKQIIQKTQQNTEGTTIKQEKKIVRSTISY
ncbi:MAG: hypothetical protein QXG39_05650, partial [Candidatus Aenigmatarchaeota archaeon]